MPYIVKFLTEETFNMKRHSSVCMILFCLSMLVAGCASGPQSQGWITLFDGSSLDRWNRTGEANWSLGDGAVMADKGGKTPSYLVSKESYGDFDLRLEFWATADTNSGVFLRASDPAKVGAATAYEVQIADARTDGTGTGAITDLAKVLPPLKTAGQWNRYEISARGGQLTVILNGNPVASAQSTKYARGPIALQHVTGTVKFRRVEIRPM
jgi:hypothetical protein